MTPADAYGPSRGLKRIGPVLVFKNLNVAAFDRAGGEQIPELQIGLPTLWAEHAERAGYDAHGVIFETNDGNWRLVRTENGWNRELVP